MKHPAISALLLTVMLLCSPANAAPGDPIQKIENQPPASGFIRWLDANGKFAIGETNNDFKGNVFIFNSDGTLDQTIDNPTANGSDGFGQELAVVGENSDRIVVGSRFYDQPAPFVDNAGRAYLFTPSETLIIENPNPTPYDFSAFGYHPARGAGDNFFISELNDSDDGSTQSIGSVHLFDGDANLLHTFDPPATATDFLQFGDVVHMVGDTIVAIGTAGFGLAGNKVYLFNADPLSPEFGAEITTLDNPFGTFPGGFGSALTSIGDTLFVGHPMVNMVHVYDVDLLSATFGQRIRTIQIPTYTGPFSSGFEGFGDSLSAIAPDKLLVGSPDKVIDGNFSVGQAYVVYADPNNLPAIGLNLLTLLAPTPQTTDDFGEIVCATSDGTLGILASGVFSGDDSVHLFEGFGVGPTNVQSTDVTFGVHQGLSDLTVSVMQGQGGAANNLSPTVSGTLDASVLELNGEVVGFHLRDFDFQAAPISGGAPFQFSMDDLRMQLDLLGNQIGRTTQVSDNSGTFTMRNIGVMNTGDAQTTIDGKNFVSIPDPFSDFSLIDLNGSIAKNGQTYQATLDFNIGEQIDGFKDKTLSFRPYIQLSGFIVLVDQTTLPTPTATPIVSPTPTPSPTIGATPTVTPSPTPSPTSTPTGGLVREYLLGLNSNPTGLDLNSDGMVDIGDLIIDLNLQSPAMPAAQAEQLIAKAIQTIGNSPAPTDRLAAPDRDFRSIKWKASKSEVMKSERSQPLPPLPLPELHVEGFEHDVLRYEVTFLGHEWELTYQFLKDKLVTATMVTRSDNAEALELAVSSLVELEIAETERVARHARTATSKETVALIVQDGNRIEANFIRRNKRRWTKFMDAKRAKLNAVTMH